jgi:hypothetical protein
MGRCGGDRYFRGVKAWDGRVGFVLWSGVVSCLSFVGQWLFIH